MARLALLDLHFFEHRGLSGNFTHVCGLDQGIVKCWGENPRGGLGVVPSVTTDTCPQGKCSTKLVTVAGVAPKVLVAGTYATFAVTMTGEVLGWGTNDYGTLGEPPQVGQNECAAPCSPTPRTIVMPK